MGPGGVRKPQREAKQTNVAIRAGDLLVCLPKAAQRDGSTALPPQPGDKSQGSMVPRGQEWKAGCGPSGAQRRAQVRCPVYTSASATVPRGGPPGQRRPQGSLFHPNNRGSSPGGSVRQLLPSLSLPTREAPHPGQRLLLLGAQVPDSATHGALGHRGHRVQVCQESAR